MRWHYTNKLVCLSFPDTPIVVYHLRARREPIWVEPHRGTALYTKSYLQSENFVKVRQNFISTRLRVCIPVCPSICMSCLPICLIRLSYLSIYLSACPSVSLYAYHLPLCLVYLSYLPSYYLSAHLFVFLAVCYLSFLAVCYLYVFFGWFLPVSFCLTVTYLYVFHPFCTSVCL